MAATAGVKPPKDVTFNDDDPSKGYVKLFLTITGLKAKWPAIGASQARNAEVTVAFKEESVNAVIQLTSGEQYQYSKATPENINPSKSAYQIKDDQLVLKLCKAEVTSWASHAKYMMSRE